VKRRLVGAEAGDPLASAVALRPAGIFKRIYSGPSLAILPANQYCLGCRRRSRTKLAPAYVEKWHRYSIGSAGGISATHFVGYVSPRWAGSMHL
jgi:hypothetical protein